MSIKESIFQLVAGIVIERPARGKTYEQWSAELAKSGQTIDRRMAASRNTAKAGATLRHITGIERWGQQRLRVFLGEPFVRDEYEGYQPGATLDLGAQRACFQETRQETIDLTQRLAQAGVPDTATVPHNDFGPLSARGWLRYLEMHASLESKKPL